MTRLTIQNIMNHKKDTQTPMGGPAQSRTPPVPAQAQRGFPGTKGDSLFVLGLVHAACGVCDWAGPPQRGLGVPFGLYAIHHDLFRLSML